MHKYSGASTLNYPTESNQAARESGLKPFRTNRRHKSGNSFYDYITAWRNLYVN